MTAAQALAELGATCAIGFFSGGNDEGSLESISLLNSAGDKTGEIDPWAEGLTAAAQQLTDTIEATMEGSFGGFAFEGYVNGRVTVTPSGPPILDSEFEPSYDDESDEEED